MLRPSQSIPAVYLCRDSVDFRKGINGLAVLVEESMSLNPFSEQLFIFCNRKRDKLRILYWERVIDDDDRLPKTQSSWGN